jgi:hypothetical protein
MKMDAERLIEMLRVLPPAPEYLVTAVQEMFSLDLPDVSPEAGHGHGDFDGHDDGFAADEYGTSQDARDHDDPFGVDHRDPHDPPLGDDGDGGWDGL